MDKFNSTIPVTMAREDVMTCSMARKDSRSRIALRDIIFVLDIYILKKSSEVNEGKDVLFTPLRVIEVLKIQHSGVH
jgi:hypothetical protein